MKIIVLNESKTSTPQINVERRCAVTPASVQRLCKKGVEVNIEAGSGELSHYLDNEYEDAGATIINDVNDALSSADMLVSVNKPSEAQLSVMKKGAIVVGHLDPFFQQPLIESIAEKALTAISVEMIPRSSRAQKMDALSQFGWLCHGDASGQSTSFNPTHDDDAVGHHQTCESFYYWSRRSGLTGDCNG